MISFLGKAKYPLAGAVLFCMLIAGFFLWNRRRGEPVSYPKSFDGTSDQLKQTVIVPTLDTPIPEGKSAIWCSSFQIAWNKLKTDVAKGPIQVKGAEAVCERLNQAEQSEEDLQPEMFYAAAGLVKDGIIKKIQDDMRQRFPEVPLPEMTGSVAVAYAYLKADVQFSKPFLENEKPFVFKGTDGVPTKVASFGIHENARGTGELRKQIDILYIGGHSIEDPEEFAIDPCNDSSPHQMMVAVLPRQQTLREILEDLQKKIANYGHEEYRHGLSFDSFLVPNMHWKIEHRFKELEGPDKPLLNPSLQDLWIDPALQVIEFKLDQRGASVSSQAMVGAKGGPRLFHFDRPFLIYMKKRDAKHPFFVMWVDNAELLIKS